MNFDEAFLKREVRRTSPDYIIFAPPCSDERADHGNEHLHVFRAKDGCLCALWTQSRFEGTFTQRPVFSKSRNGGLTWSDPVCLLKDAIDAENGKNMGSWASVAISKSGKMYVLYSKHGGNLKTHEQGWTAVLSSDDAGETWSDEAVLKMPRSKFDPDDPLLPPGGFPWQTSLRMKNGTVILGISRNRVASFVPPQPQPPIWVEHPCACEFIRFDNIDDDPAPADLKLTLLAQNDDGLCAPLPGHPECVSGEEPSVQELPDGRLFCTFRTAEGHVWYSVSEDSGVTWRKTEMLRYRDGGEGVKHPLSPCPFFRISETEYLLFIHNNDGYFGQARPQLNGNWRNPLYILRGEFRPGAHQPIWFSQPVEYMNNGGVSIERMDLALYGDLTIEDGEPVLWYPDRKFFLLGRRITRQELSAMPVPQDKELGR